MRPRDARFRLFLDRATRALAMSILPVALAKISEGAARAARAESERDSEVLACGCDMVAARGYLLEGGGVRISPMPLAACFLVAPWYLASLSATWFTHIYHHGLRSLFVHARDH